MCDDTSDSKTVRRVDRTEQNLLYMHIRTLITSTAHFRSPRSIEQCTNKNCNLVSREFSGLNDLCVTNYFSASMFLCRIWSCKMAQAINGRPLMRAYQVRSEAITYGFVVDKVTLRQVFLQVLWFSPVSIMSAMLHARYFTYLATDYI